MPHKFFDKNSTKLAHKSASIFFKNEKMSNQELAEELHEPIFRKCEKQKYTHPL